MIFCLKYSIRSDLNRVSFIEYQIVLKFRDWANYKIVSKQVFSNLKKILRINIASKL